MRVLRGKQCWLPSTTKPAQPPLMWPHPYSLNTFYHPVLVVSEVRSRTPSHHAWYRGTTRSMGLLQMGQVRLCNAWKQRKQQQT